MVKVVSVKLRRGVVLLIAGIASLKKLTGLRRIDSFDYDFKSLLSTAAAVAAILL